MANTTSINSGKTTPSSEKLSLGRHVHRLLAGLLQSLSAEKPSLSPHLLADVGEDDIRPQAQLSLIHQQSNYQVSAQAMMNRGF